jgi:hypothetical protein
MALPIRFAYTDNGSGPPTKHYTLAASQTQTIGSPMKFASGLLSQAANAAATATGLVGFANTTNQSAFGFDYGDIPATEVVTGRVNTCAVTTATRDTTFYGQISTGTSAIVAPAVTDIGVAYSLIKQSDNVWTVDRSNTSDVCVVVTDIDPTLYGTGVVFFKVRNASLSAL